MSRFTPSYIYWAFESQKRTSIIKKILMIDVRQIFEEIEKPALSVRAGVRNENEYCGILIGVPCSKLF